VQVPLCLSYHRPNPLDAHEVAKLAKSCRGRLFGQSSSPAPALPLNLGPSDAGAQHVPESV
jgi:hypothetical protein